ncbi:MAG TPA: methyl-accepting chemotaxis protein [Acetivibrio sp.]|nr:methyl-accepting chemotaxis protein [Acetivibrio sp.]
MKSVFSNRLRKLGSKFLAMIDSMKNKASVLTRKKKKDCAKGGNKLNSSKGMKNVRNSTLGKIVSFFRLGDIKIGVKITVSFVLIILVTLTTAFYTSMSSVKKSMEEEAIFSTQTIVEQSAKSIKVLLEDVDALAMLISWDEEIANQIKSMNETDDPAALARASSFIFPRLRALKGTKSDKIMYIIASSLKGDFTVQGEGIIGGMGKDNYFDTIAYKEFKREFERTGQYSYWVDMHFSDHIGQLTYNSPHNFCLFKAIHTATSLKPVGYLQVSVNEASIGNVLKEMKLPYNGDVYLVGANWNMIYNRQNPDDNAFRVNEINKINEQGQTKAEVLGRYEFAKIDRNLQEVLYRMTDDNIGDEGFKQRDRFITDSIMERIYEDINSQEKMSEDIKGVPFKEIINGEEMLVTYYTIRSIKGTALNWTMISLTPISEISAQVNNAVTWIILIGIICFIFAALIAILITYDISSGVKVLSKFMGTIKKGNLDIEYNLKRKDEIGSLGDNFRDMVSNLRNLIGSIKGASNVAIESSHTVSSTSEQSYASIQEFFTLLTEVNKEIETQKLEIDNNEKIAQSLSDKIQVITKDFGNVNEIIFGAKELGEKGKDTVNSLQQNAQQVKVTINEFSELINVLRTESGEISKITETIKDIAKQTNLLALNATIEAARAGEAGRGFAVVAHSIKKLADQSRESASFIERKLKFISNTIEETGEVVKASDNVISEHDLAVNDTIEKFDSIVDFMDNVYNQVRSINNSIMSIDEARVDIMESLKNMNDSSRKNVGSINEITVGFNELVDLIKHLVSLSEDLSKLSKNLESSIDMFKV